LKASSSSQQSLGKMATEQMDSEQAAANEWDQPLYIAYHRTDRKSAVTVKEIEHALTCNVSLSYDFQRLG
jgi:hypothetical protein